MKGHHVVAEIRRRARDRSSSLCFYWIASPADRDEFSRDLRAEAADLPLCPIVVRIGGFADPNAVAVDLLRILESARSELEHPGFSERIRAANRLDVVLIARRELELESSSSPIALPSWFPIFPSTSVTAAIIDLTWSTHVSLSAEELHGGEIGSLLFELDRELVRNLRASHLRDHRLVNSLHDALKRKPDESVPFTGLLSRAEKTLDGVRNPRDYRPTRREPTIVGRLWNLANTTTADGLPQRARSLANALDLTPGAVEGFHESLVTVLGRPSFQLEDPVQRWGFNLIVTIGAACQLLTAAHHADDYAEYPLPLVRSLSRDTRQSLDQAVSVLGTRR